MDRTEALNKAKAWWSVVSDTSLVPTSASDVQSILADLLVELSAALDAEEFDPAAAVGIGNALVNMRLTNPVVVARSAEVLTSLPGLQDGKGVEFVRSRGSALLGSFGSSYAAALQRLTIADQAAVYNTLAAARNTAADALRASNTRFKVVFENAAVAIGVSDIKGRVIEANPALAALVNRRADELAGTSLFELIHPDDRPRIRESVFAELVERGGGTLRLEGRYRRSDGSYGWGMAAITYVVGVDGQDNYLLMVGEDITERRELQFELYRQARHDPLTGLPNRLLLLETLRDAIDSAATADTIGLCFIDLDGFKAVNDKYGHGAGDKLLAAVALRLRDAGAQSCSLVARVGGDEFVAVLPAPAEIDGVIAAGREFLRVLREPFDIAGHSHSVSASIGVLVPAVAGTDPEGLLDAVDSALYRAKEGGGGVLYLRET